MKKVLLVLFACAATLCACNTMKIVDYKVSAFNKTAAEVEKAVFIGCADRGWDCKKITQGQIEGVLYKGNYTLAVDIFYGEGEEYTVKYKNSENLKYKQGKNKDTIHEAYAAWVANLNKSIRRALTDPAWAKRIANANEL